MYSYNPCKCTCKAGVAKCVYKLRRREREEGGKGGRGREGGRGKLR